VCVRAELIGAREGPVGEPVGAGAVDLIATDHLPGVKGTVKAVAVIDHVGGVVDQHGDEIVVAQDLWQGESIPLERLPGMERLAETAFHEVVTGGDRGE
jgi:hypothetical protein